MTKNKKVIALFIAILMLMSNFMGLAKNISIAVHENVTVTFSVENDGGAHLTDDGKTLNYRCEDDSSYDFQLVQEIIEGNNVTYEPLVLTLNNSSNGDTYTASNIPSNANIKIYSPRLNLGVVNLRYGGQPQAMVPETQVGEQWSDYYSSYLKDIDDVDNYQFRIEEVHDNGGGQPQDLSNVDFNLYFENTSWEVDNTTVTASIVGKDLTNNPVGVKGNTEITLTNFNPSTMEVRVTEHGVQNPFWTTLRVDQNGVTRIVDNNARNFPVGPYDFEVAPISQSGGSGNLTNIAETEFTVDFGEGAWEVRNKITEASEQGVVEHFRGDEVIELSNWDSKLMQAMIRVIDPSRPYDECDTIRLTVTNGQTRIMDVQRNGGFYFEDGFYLEFFVERYTGELPENNLPQPNDSANSVTISSSNANPKTYIYGRFSINGFPVIIDGPEPGEQVDLANYPASQTVNNFQYFYDANEDNGKVRITFSAIFENKYVGSVTVNDETFVIYDENRPPEENLIDYSNGTDWLLHYNCQEVSFDVLVDKADSYNIVADLAPMPGDEVAIGNFLWSDAPGEVGHDGYIGNATLEVLQVQYEIDLNYDGDYNDDGEQVTVDIDDEGHFTDPNNIIEYAPYGEVGSLVVPAYSICLMKITPDYGYQVLTFGANANSLFVGEHISEFIFEAHKGNFHLGAQVVQVDDAVSI